VAENGYTEVEEKRQKVRKLRVANDREDTLLIPGDPMRAHVNPPRPMPAPRWPRTVTPPLAPRDSSRLETDNPRPLDAPFCLASVPNLAFV
jgi:hypothetical protein